MCGWQSCPWSIMHLYPSTANSSTIIASGLIGSWKFDEGVGDTAADSSGNNNLGALVGSPTWVDGRLGKALSFDGVDDYVEIGDKKS